MGIEIVILGGLIGCGLDLLGIKNPTVFWVIGFFTAVIGHVVK